MVPELVMVALRPVDRIPEPRVAVMQLLLVTVASGVEELIGLTLTH
jgi:hypothetical protein